MDCMSTMLGNGRSVSAKVGSNLMPQHRKQEWKNIYRNYSFSYFNKSLASASRCSWPLLVCAKRSLKEQIPGFLGIDSPIVAGNSPHMVFATTVGSEEKASESTEDHSGNPVIASSGGYFGIPVDRTEDTGHKEDLGCRKETQGPGQEDLQSVDNQLQNVEDLLQAQDNKERGPKESREDNNLQLPSTPASHSQLEALPVSTVRAKLIRKLSEANQYNRHLQRQINYKEKTLNKCKNELAVMDLELQALVALAKDIAKNGAKFDSRKINGRYVHSHLVLRLEELREKLLEQIKDVDAVQFCEVPLVWYGMAEDVKVMGSFDGWTYGEQMSPESSASFTKFSTTLKLRPGRYEIKFLVDGEWKVSPELQSVGEGPMANNLLVVE